MFAKDKFMRMIRQETDEERLLLIQWVLLFMTMTPEERRVFTDAVSQRIADRKKRERKQCHSVIK
jgi:hypothetical protein